MARAHLPCCRLTERNIILLTFLVARQGLRTVQRAFPCVRIVTAAIDAKLTERTFPVWAHALVGTAGGDADFASRIAPLAAAESQDLTTEDVGSKGLESRLEALRFSRTSHESTPAEPEQRKAWVIEPGMGHIGDRYYLK